MKYAFTFICATIIAASVMLVVRLDNPPTIAPPPEEVVEIGIGEPAPAPEEVADALVGEPAPPPDIEPEPSVVVPVAPKRQWAEAIEKPGLPNFYRVSDTLYRGAQPTEEGVRELKAMGIRTIVNLRSFHSDSDEIGLTGIKYEHIYMKAWHAEEEDIVRFLRIVTDKNRTPVFVHCQYGADRTGTMVAVYRIVVQGWHKEEALREMTDGPYNFHGVWRNLVEFLQNLDIEKIRKEAGIPPPDAAGEDKLKQETEERNGETADEP